MMVKWQDSGEDIQHKSWSHKTVYVIGDQKMCEDI